MNQAIDTDNISIEQGNKELHLSHHLQKVSTTLSHDVNQSPITTTATVNDTIYQRARSQTITQKDLNESTIPLNDQDNLHHAIQKIDIMNEDDPFDSDLDSQIDNEHTHIHSNRSTVTSISSLLSNDTNYDMLLARLDSPLSSALSTAPTTTSKGHNMHILANYPSSSSSPGSTSSTTPSTASSFSTSSFTADPMKQDIDWEFWSHVISNADQIIKSNKLFTYHIRQGIPPSLRGTIWPILSQTKNNKNNSNNINNIGPVKTPLKEKDYVDLLNKDNIYEKAITWDLDSLFADQDGVFLAHANRIKDPLFHLLKAYANYDDHVGYSKGFAFIALPLLLHMPEEEAFCVFVELMNGVYQWKTLYIPPMDGLSRHLFQLDGLMLEHLPRLYQHFNTYGVHPNDYAKTWFATLFVSVSPSLELVYPIYDILLSEGTDVLVGFGLALLKVNQDQLLGLDEQDELIKYLSNHQLCDAYKDDTKKWMQDAMAFKIQKKRLVKLSKDHQQVFSSSMSRRRSGSLSTTFISTKSTTKTTVNDMEILRLARQQNKTLMESVKQRQGQLDILSKQQTQAAKELIDAKMELARARQLNDDLRQQSFDLKKALDALPAEIEEQLKQRIHTLAGKNMNLVDKNSELEYQLTDMETMLKDIKGKFAKSENEREELLQRLMEQQEWINNV
ncbi:rab-GTPase-TBC domain-containing protein [Halteromyces radiatus]|uniref:rab-GTPase-TBC domain-containing protein n=1 Tax=Halteromyces radiatus TaxID=101107 RepID=UPI00221F66CB|nr:rab-GTPase-TBC domain-containing protein [Halteromyces radiatus]KAI8099466.1 rab-GTPase-TBC domain-containing protein [Halteromyces radiatus]